MQVFLQTSKYCLQCGWIQLECHPHSHDVKIVQAFINGLHHTAATKEAFDAFVQPATTFPTLHFVRCRIMTTLRFGSTGDKFSSSPEILVPHNDKAHTEGLNRETWFRLAIVQMCLCNPVKLIQPLVNSVCCYTLNDLFDPTQMVRITPQHVERRQPCCLPGHLRYSRYLVT